jgi:hypothetical protein
MIFQAGMAIGKFHGVMSPTTPIGRHVPLVGELGRSRLAPEAATLTRHVEGHVDRFLDVASGLGKNLAHLLGHLSR